MGSWLKSCTLCPRTCKVNRLKGEKGYCRAPGLSAPVASAQLHHGEEPAISGRRGSGTVFFAGCTMGCRFCQNHDISHGEAGEQLTARDLAALFLQLQLSGAHNLNLVTPTPHVTVILQALAIARDNGCNLPVVYNTSGYEHAAVIRRLAGLVEIYMPDFKYADARAAERLSHAPDYVEHCRSALAEMQRQVGPLHLDESGAAKGGLLVRHLVLPHDLAGTEQVMGDLVRICGPGVWVSLLSQYHPAHKAGQTPGLERPVSLAEFQRARQALEQAGISHGYVQGIRSQNGEYLPGAVLHQQG